MSVTTPAPSRIATLARLPHLTIPGGYVEADEEMAAGGFVEVPAYRGASRFSGASDTDREVLAFGAFERADSLERVFNARVQPDHGIAEADMAEDFDIDAFNQLKRTIAHQSYRSLQLGEERWVYIHPTADEFRALVREITGAVYGRGVSRGRGGDGGNGDYRSLSRLRFQRPVNQCDRQLCTHRHKYRNDPSPPRTT